MQASQDKITNPLVIRNLEDADLEKADEILTLAFGGPVSRLEDLRLYRRIEPAGWFVAAQAERLVGMVGAANYGTIAHVGLMAVHPEAQRQGIGMALMRFLLDKLEQQGVRLVTLDASKMGRPLYDRLGFIPYDETITFQRPVDIHGNAKPCQPQIISMRDLGEIIQADKEIFGADRRKLFQVLLDQFPGRAFLQRDAAGRLVGYLFAQKYRIGPWVMLSPGWAEELFSAALTLPYEGIISATIPGGNLEAIGLLQRVGFKQVRTNRHMCRGTDGPPGQRQKIYSQTSLAVG
jgi:predicted N-acetyltransferase YhbS